MKTKLLFIMAVLATALAATPALAVTYSITESNNGTTGGDFATVDVTLVGTNALVTFTASDSYLLAEAGVNAPGSTGTSFVSGYEGVTALTAADFNQVGPKTMDGFGIMNIVYTGPNFGAGGTLGTGFTELTFLISNSFTDPATVLVANDKKGFLAAIHYIDPSWTGEGGNTFFAGDSGGGFPPIPIPPTVWLMGSGLLGLVGLGWRRGRKS